MMRHSRMDTKENPVFPDKKINVLIKPVKLRKIEMS
jgi:hypothetical protein